MSVGKKAIAGGLRRWIGIWMLLREEPFGDKYSKIRESCGMNKNLSGWGWAEL